MDLLYQGACATCGVLLVKGEPAYWDADARVVYCLSHNPIREIVVAPSIIDRGVAGRSVQHEHDRRVMPRHDRVLESHPYTGGVLVAITGEPQTRAWSTGTAGERIVGECLDGLADRGVIALHDRNIPGSRGNIDEIAIGPSGVYVIDVKHYEGGVVTRDLPGSIFRSRTPRLIIGGRDRTKLVSKMAWQMDVVRSALEELPGRAFCAGKSDADLRRRTMGSVPLGIRHRWGLGRMAKRDGKGRVQTRPPRKPNGSENRRAFVLQAEAGEMIRA